jgi:hypothetical protein
VYIRQIKNCEFTFWIKNKNAFRNRSVFYFFMVKCKRRKRK